VKKNILITGGSNGIGLELVYYFLKKNNTVFTTFKTDKKKLSILKNEYKNDLWMHKLDLSKTSSINTFSKKITNKVKSLDIIIFSAIKNIKRKPFQKITLKEHVNVYTSNFLSYVNILKKLFIFFKKKHKIKIIHVSSLTSKNGSWGLCNYGPYKAGIDNLFKCLNHEIREYIKFESVYLGAVDTKGYRYTNRNARNKKFMSVKSARLKILKKL
jgi:short-subunit dehydrogenase